MVGLIHDPPNRRGLSHLTEHVICAESKAHTAQQVESIMARTLGSESALITTSKTVTTYGPADLLKKIIIANYIIEVISSSVTLKEVVDLD
jgi:predicted Zn-dependent peptidase